MKIGYFKESNLIEHTNLASSDIEAMKSFFEKKNIKNIILSSTAVVMPEIEDFLIQNYNYTRLKTETPVPIENIYRTPKTLGKDRVAGVIGAKVLYPKKDCLVIDAGTCITYDFINAKNIYLGGNIAPGISLRLRAMDEFTAALPLVSKQQPDTNKGYSTETAIRAGAVWGTAYEIMGFIQQLDQQTETLTILLTGGDAKLLDKLIDRETIVNPYLVLIGLNKILEYNVE